MMKVKETALLASLMTALAIGTAQATLPLELSYALEDAAFQIASQMNADKRVTSGVRRIAFVKIISPIDTKTKAPEMDETDEKVFESALVATPGALQFVVHGSHDSDWTLINEIFDSAVDFDWDPKTCPKLKQLKLCDAVLVVRYVGMGWSKGDNAHMVKLTGSLVKVETAEQIWGGNITGKYDDGGPDNEKVSPNWRKALEACARDAVAKLPASLDGYGVLMLPIEGRTGRAMSQVFLNALTASGRQDKIRIYDLPNGNASDRTVARFLRERLGGGAVVGDSVLNGAVAQVLPGFPGKLAILSGMVSVVNENPKVRLTEKGLPLDFLGGALTEAAEARKSYEITTDLKLRDVNDNFRVLAAVAGTGLYEPPKSVVDWLRETVQDRGFWFLCLLAGGLVFAIVVLVVIARLFRALSRPR